MSRLRSPGTAERDLENPTLHFLGGWMTDVRVGGDLSLARRLLDDAKAGGDCIAQPMSHGASAVPDLGRY